MGVVVELGALEGFILDDDVAGRLDNTVYTLGGTVFKDISSRVLGLSTIRGKNRDLDRFSAGTLSVTLTNNDRAFDPNYSASPFAGAIVPRRELLVTIDGVRVITTTIDDWSYDYAPLDSRATIDATDDFTLLARQTLTPGTAVSQATGARVTAVLDMAGVLWPAGARSIDTGQSVLGADVFEGNVLSYLQKVADSEQGLLFVGKSGNLVFRDRLDATPNTGSVTEFADDGSGIPFQLTTVNYGSELLYNQATVNAGVGTATADNARSQVAYGVSSYELDTLVSTTTQLQNLADFLVQKYGDPEYRFETITVNYDSLTSGQKAEMLALEVGDISRVTFTPNGVGDPISQYGQVIRVGNTAGPGRHDMTISFTSLDWTFLVLDDAVFGKLDSNNALAF
jgi:hypothetical protein